MGNVISLESRAQPPWDKKQLVEAVALNAQKRGYNPFRAEEIAGILLNAGERMEAWSGQQSFDAEQLPAANVKRIAEDALRQAMEIFIGAAIELAYPLQG